MMKQCLSQFSCEVRCVQRGSGMIVEQTHCVRAQGALGHVLHEMHIKAKCNACACACMCAPVHVCVCIWEVVVRGDSWPLPGHLVPVTTLCVCESTSLVCPAQFSAPPSGTWLDL